MGGDRKGKMTSESKNWGKKGQWESKDAQVENIPEDIMVIGMQFTNI